MMTSYICLDVYPSISHQYLCFCYAAQGNHGVRNRKSLSDEQDKVPPEDRKPGQKRVREEGCGSSSAAITDVKGVGTVGDVIEKPPTTSTEHLSELEKLKMV